MQYEKKLVHFPRSTVMALCGVIAAMVILTFLAPHNIASADQACKHVQGKFSSVPAPADQCTSPVGMCTQGDLKGRLHGTYEFAMASLIPTGDPTIPLVFFYTGLSIITMDSGDLLVGTDSGAIDLNPLGAGVLSTMITITDGTGGHEGAKGYLQLRGNLNFATGGATGDYRGEICTP